MSSTKDNILKVAFVGGGAMTSEHARAFRGLDGVECVGITNRSIDKAKAIADQQDLPHVAADIEALVAETKPDLLVMAVYEPAIEEVAARCLATGASVLMEKPIGLDLAAARRVAEAAGQSKGQVFVGLNRRTMGSTRRVLADLESRPDETRFIHVQDQQSLETARAIGHSENVVDNWMFANSIHLVDCLSALARGEVSKVEVLKPWTPDDPGIVLANVEFTSGDNGIYEAIWNGPGPWAATISTPSRRWEMRPLEKAVYQNVGERSLNDAEPDPQDTDFKPGFRAQAQSVVDALRGKPSRAANIQDALATTELVAKIYGKSV